MNSEALNKYWNVRRAHLEQICADVALFKECEQCRSISWRNAGVCGLCKGYRFIEDPATVLATVAEMGRHPYPASAGVAPRLAMAGGVEASKPGL